LGKIWVGFNQNTKARSVPF